MSGPESADEASAVVMSYAYFMVRLQYALGKERPVLAGAIERLGTGEKQRFHTGEELLGLLSAWPGGPREPSGGGI